MPIVVILSGPNGAGKTTAAPTLLQGPFRVDAFVNADIIARGLGGMSPGETDFEAGRIMIERLDKLGEAGANFAFETTLASKTLLPRVTKLKDRGYIFALLYVWVPSPEDSIARVQDRVRRGGHFVPDREVRRRHGRGLRNFFQLYRPIADVWRFYDNADPTGPRLIA
ncbi:MAG TPA: zeta toxin family protein, partial [Gemmataceae bacterium]|nr:zeta toxin family protein [Gemmataceae bacterium]